MDRWKDGWTDTGGTIPPLFSVTLSGSSLDSLNQIYPGGFKGLSPSFKNGRSPWSKTVISKDDYETNDGNGRKFTGVFTDPPQSNAIRNIFVFTNLVRARCISHLKVRPLTASLLGYTEPVLLLSWVRETMLYKTRAQAQCSKEDWIHLQKRSQILLQRPSFCGSEYRKWCCEFLLAKWLFIERCGFIVTLKLVF